MGERVERATVCRDPVMLKDEGTWVHGPIKGCVYELQKKETRPPFGLGEKIKPYENFQSLSCVRIKGSEKTMASGLLVW